ncbi:uncharacterized protein LOC126979699 [Leptidea sinapis]|uniref:uncharacterized protein LOC126979699 n=1 Tax=Leptidea sinapis TaxID=189913 RepID=UPI002131ECF6|nr:uncharacterized protein LOC126979699 [Leptidea sinapis]XP_050685114.1 uncharacterized protein LOC126979699 [Leptidea sinapis]XP_050685116.1 uncharacterized protein LOC126979699 [Leptidea sinapis]
MASNLSENAIVSGWLGYYCLACHAQFPGEDTAKKHITQNSHKEKFNETSYEVANHFIRKINQLYFCELCNLVLKTKMKVKLHIKDQKHTAAYIKKALKQLESVITFNGVVVSEESWNGISDGTCIICNCDCDDKNQHIHDPVHIINLYQSNLSVQDTENVFRVIDETSFQCLICNQVVSLESKSQHFEEKTHNANKRLKVTGTKLDINSTVKELKPKQVKTLNVAEKEDLICKALKAPQYIETCGNSYICILCEWELPENSVLSHMGGAHHCNILKLHRARIQKLKNQQDINSEKDESNCNDINENNKIQPENETCNDNFKIIKSLSRFESNGIRVNLQQDYAFCNTCCDEIDMNFNVIEKHIFEHKSLNDLHKHSVSSKGTKVLIKEECGSSGSKMENEEKNIIEHTSTILVGSQDQFVPSVITKESNGDKLQKANNIVSELSCTSAEKVKKPKEVNTELEDNAIENDLQVNHEKETHIVEYTASNSSQDYSVPSKGTDKSECVASKVNIELENKKVVNNFDINHGLEHINVHKELNGSQNDSNFLKSTEEVKIESKLNIEIAKYAKANNLQFDSKKMTVFCRMCENSVPPNLYNMKEHINGRSHKSNIEQFSKIDKLQPETTKCDTPFSVEPKAEKVSKENRKLDSETNTGTKISIAMQNGSNVSQINSVSSKTNEKSNCIAQNDNIELENKASTNNIKSNQKGKHIIEQKASNSSNNNSNASKSTEEVKSTEKVKGRKEELENYAQANNLELNPKEATAFCTKCAKHVPATVQNLKDHINGKIHQGYVKPSSPITKPELEKLERILTRNLIILTDFISYDNFNDIVLNEKICLSRASFALTIKTKDSYNFQCIRCSVNLGKMDVTSHGLKGAHGLELFNVPVVTNIESEFIREYQPGSFHCGFCNAIFTSWEDINSHIETIDHRLAKKSAEWRLSVYLPQIKANNTKRDCFYINE